MNMSRRSTPRLITCQSAPGYSSRKGLLIGIVLRRIRRRWAAGECGERKRSTNRIRSRGRDEVAQIVPVNSRSDPSPTTALRATIETVVGEGIAIIDSAETTAETVRSRLDALNLRGSGSLSVQHFLVTDAEERFQRIAGQFLEQEIGSLELVDL